MCDNHNTELTILWFLLIMVYKKLLSDCNLVGIGFVYSSFVSFAWNLCFQLMVFGLFLSLTCRGKSWEMSQTLQTLYQSKETMELFI